MAKAPENAPTRLIYGFHAVSAKLRHAPDAVLEIYLSADRKDARVKKFIAQRELSPETRYVPPLLNPTGVRYPNRIAVIGGHVIACLVALVADHYLPLHPLTLAGTVAFVIVLLGLLRLTHPPAGATALVVLLTHPDWWFVLSPVLAGAVTLVVVAVGVHWIPPRVAYPLPVPKPPASEM